MKIWIKSLTVKHNKLEMESSDDIIGLLKSQIQHEEGMPSGCHLPLRFGGRLLEDGYYNIQEESILSWNPLE